MSTEKNHAQPSEEFLVLAETLADIKTRFERVESELSTQARPLESALATLNAAVSGIKALQFHVLDNNLGALSQRVEEQRVAIDQQVNAVVAELKKADADAFARVDSSAGQLRGEIAGISEQLGRLVTQFSSELSRVEFEAQKKAAEFAAVPGPKGEPGAAINPTGSYAADRAYNRLDLVSFLGGSFISNVDNNRERPSSKAKTWTQLASRGGPGGSASDIGALTGIDANVKQWVTTPNSSNLRGALTDETGTGAAVFADTPTLVTPVLGAATGTSIVLGGATGGATTGVVNALGFKIGGVDVGSSSDTYWVSDAPGIKYTAGPISLTGTPTGSAGDMQLTNLTVNSATGPTTTNLTLAGGSSGASLVLGQGASGSALFNSRLFAGTANWPSTDIGNSAGRSILNGTSEPILLLWNEEAASVAEKSAIYLGGKTGVSATTMGGGRLIAGLLSASDRQGYISVSASNAAGFATTPALYIPGQASGAAASNVLVGGTTDITGSGGLKVFGTTASTSTTSGALQVAGGVGIAGKLYTGSDATVGGNLTVSGTTDVTAQVIASGSVQFSGGVSVTKALNIGYNATVLKAGSDAVAAGSFYSLDNVGAGAARRNWLWQLGASNTADFWNFDGSSWTKQVQFGATTTTFSGTGTHTFGSGGNTVTMAAGNIRATGNLGVGNSAAATTLGSVAKKIEVFDAAGSSLGFVPVYDSIT